VAEAFYPTTDRSDREPDATIEVLELTAAVRRQLLDRVRGTKPTPMPTFMDSEVSDTWTLGLDYLLRFPSGDWLVRSRSGRTPTAQLHLTAPGDEHSLRTFRRVLRQMTDRVAADSGSCLLHAASINHPDASLIMGAKRSGKTTLLLEWARADRHASIGGFDTLFVRSSGPGDGFECLSVPDHLAVNVGTAVRTGLFVSRFPAELRDGRDLWAVSSDDHKVRVAPEEVAREVPMSGRPAPVRSVIFPCLDPSVRSPRLEPCVGPTAAVIAASFVITGPVSKHEGDLLQLHVDSLGREPTAARLVDAIRDGAIPSYRLSYGEAVDSGVLADALAAA
jgi:hypothetical protein